MADSNSQPKQKPLVFLFNHRKRGLTAPPKRARPYYSTIVKLLKERKNIFPAFSRTGGFKASIQKLQEVYQAARPSSVAITYSLAKIVEETCNSCAADDNDFVQWQSSPHYQEYLDFISAFDLDATVFSNEDKLDAPVDVDPMDEKKCALDVGSLDFPLYKTQ
eukprot:71569_1